MVLFDVYIYTFIISYEFVCPIQRIGWESSDKRLGPSNRFLLNPGKVSEPALQEVYTNVDFLPTLKKLVMNMFCGMCHTLSSEPVYEAT